MHNAFSRAARSKKGAEQVSNGSGLESEGGTSDEATESATAVPCCIAASVILIAVIFGVAAFQRGFTGGSRDANKTLSEGRSVLVPSPDVITASGLPVRRGRYLYLC